MDRNAAVRPPDGVSRVDCVLIGHFGVSRVDWPFRRLHLWTPAIIGMNYDRNVFAQEKQPAGASHAHRVLRARADHTRALHHLCARADITCA